MSARNMSARNMSARKMQQNGPTGPGLPFRRIKSAAINRPRQGDTPLQKQIKEDRISMILNELQNFFINVLNVNIEDLKLVLGETYNILMSDAGNKSHGKIIREFSKNISRKLLSEFPSDLLTQVSTTEDSWDTTTTSGVTLYSLKDQIDLFIRNINDFSDKTIKESFYIEFIKILQDPTLKLPEKAVVAFARLFKNVSQIGGYCYDQTIMHMFANEVLNIFKFKPLMSEPYLSVAGAHLRNGSVCNPDPSLNPYYDFKYGMAPNILFHSTIGNMLKVPDPNILAFAQKFFTPNYLTLDPRLIATHLPIHEQQIKLLEYLLYKNHMLGIALPVTDEFISKQILGYNHLYDSDSTIKEGDLYPSDKGHAITVIGYDADVFYCKNTWGIMFESIIPIKKEVMRKILMDQLGAGANTYIYVMLGLKDQDQNIDNPYLLRFKALYPYGMEPDPPPNQESVDDILSDFAHDQDNIGLVASIKSSTSNWTNRECAGQLQPYIRQSAFARIGTYDNPHTPILFLLEAILPLIIFLVLFGLLIINCMRKNKVSPEFLETRSRRFRRQGRARITPAHEAHEDEAHEDEAPENEAEIVIDETMFNNLLELVSAYENIPDNIKDKIIEYKKLIDPNNNIRLEMPIIHPDTQKIIRTRKVKLFNLLREYEEIRGRVLHHIVLEERLPNAAVGGKRKQKYTKTEEKYGRRCIYLSNRKHRYLKIKGEFVPYKTAIKLLCRM